jgi:CHAD domain-containing protein
MTKTIAERIELLEQVRQPVVGDDLITEAGRKVLLDEFIRVLRHEAGSRTGEDIEDVHDMRVATRRMRSVFRLLAPYYKRNAIHDHQEMLRRLAWALGNVRDRDILIENLRTYIKPVRGNGRAELLTVIDALDQERITFRAELVELLDSKLYRRFLKDFTEFLTVAGTAAKTPSTDVSPSQVRHILPVMVHHRLAAVRAYDPILSTADATTLHALRIEFKRLRYAVSLFQKVLGDQIDDFITSIKAVQDCLGHMNDTATARGLLEGFQSAAVEKYLAHLETQETALLGEFTELWVQFNSRKIQQKLSTALLALS